MGLKLWCSDLQHQQNLILPPKITESETLGGGASQSVYSEVFLVGSVQSLSRVRLSAIQWTAACQASLSTPNSQSFLKLMSIELVMASNHLTLCRPLLLPPSIFPSIRVFSSESVLHIRWPKYWSFSFSISPSNGYSGLIFFRLDRWIFQSKELSRGFSNTTVQKHQFLSTQPSLWSYSHVHI